MMYNTHIHTHARTRTQVFLNLCTVGADDEFDFHAQFQDFFESQITRICGSLFKSQELRAEIERILRMQPGESEKVELSHVGSSK